MDIKRIKKLDPEINPITFKDGRGIIHTFYPTADCKMIAMITKRWNDCNEPITKVEIK